ncbi:MAG: YggS family pyridoxal phosphate-dependent enzyme [Candidatus Limnocylindrales bacterium]
MTEPASSVEDFRSARDEVLARIAAACARVGRDPADVSLVAVSKTVDPARLRDAVAAGLTVLGENRVQEGSDKRALVPGATWHLIGPLQSNKARRAIETFEVIQSVASVDLGARLDRLAAELRPGQPVPVFVQVNVDEDPDKSGALPVDASDVVDGLLALPGLEVRGLMTIGRFGVDAAVSRSTFRALRELGSMLRPGRPGLGAELSMGMSDDFEVAVEEGATVVRVGRALFGDRPPRPDAGRLP